MSEHTCRECEDFTVHTQLDELWLAGHRFWWTLMEALRIPQVVEWLNGKLTQHG